MVRSISTTTLDSNSPQRPSTAFHDWQSMGQESMNEYSLYTATPMRKQQSLQPIVEGVTLFDDSVVEYSPDGYVNTCIEPVGSSLPLSLSLPQQSQQLHVQLTTPSLEWSSSSDSSTSPSTPSTALMTPVTQSSNTMSRQSSYNPHFLDQVPMLRVASDSSCMLPILAEDGVFPFPCNVESKTINSTAVDSSHFLNFTGSSNEAFFSPASVSVSASASTLASSPINEQPYLAEDMRRSASTSSSEGNVSDASAPSSTCSRQSRREREINAQAAARKIAPKASLESSDETESTSSNAKMTRIRSEDGSSKTVGVISKTPYVRPQHPKIMCQYCSERPEGFRGTHELDRHIARAHATRRKGYICVDFSADKKFLANCKHCRNKKVYGAYYNAAAHLRRAHFHPRKRGRKGKNDEKRGGIGGGDHPAMDYLKQHWIKEVEVDNKPLPQSPESASDDAPEPVEAAYDTAYEVDASSSSSSSYPPSQQQVPASMTAAQVPIDPTQYVDYGMSMHASEPMMLYDDTTAFAAYDPNMVTPNDLNNFQFDVYMAQ
ncbi:hypothetical protein N0V83_004202 [Neocucurbitaria cava]|uniref:DUF7896 domain-containing protein n=1 Tax=Neocucurbitaria cava TaxID=798079 RepID=A0A9W9CNV3_9PLEO|nr:hypothetical protein N0V83_004202 [Neocucurbitaria cava]